MIEAVTDSTNSSGGSPLGRGRSMSWLASELAVVFVGVVLGLAFSAWWQDVQDQRDIRLSLARLSDNLTTTLHDLQTDVGILEQSAEAARMLINTDASERQVDSTVLALKRLFDFRTPVAESAEYKALTSTGKLRHISNPKIITGATAIYEQLPYLQYIADISRNKADDVHNKIAMGLVYRNIPKFEYDEPAFTLDSHGEVLLTRPDVRSMIATAGYWAWYQAEMYRVVITEIQVVISSIETELQ